MSDNHVIKEGPQGVSLTPNLELATHDEENQLRVQLSPLEARELGLVLLEISLPLLMAHLNVPPNEEGRGGPH